MSKRWVPITCMLLAAAALCAAWPAAVRADVVTLKSGSVLRGEVVGEDDETVTLRVTYGTIHIRKTHVRSVEKEDGLRSFLDEAEAQEEANNVGGAIRVLEKALARFPDSLAARAKLIELYKRQAAEAKERGENPELRRVCRRILQLSPEDEQAVSWLKSAEDAARNAPAQLAEARLTLSLELYRESLDRLQELVDRGSVRLDEVKKDLAEAHAGYGRRLLEMGRFTSAREHYRKAITLNPDLLQEYRHEVVISRLSPLVDEINRKGDDLPQTRWETLAVELETIVDMEKDNVQSRYALAVAYTNLKRYRQAADIFGALVSEKPDYENLEDSLNGLIQKAQAKVKAEPIPLVFDRKRFARVKPGKEEILETRHFVIHHHNDELALLVARGAEYYLARNYKALLGEVPDDPWPKKCDIYLYPSREIYLHHSHQASWSPAMAGATAIGGRLREHHVMTYQTVDDLLSSHLSHEITHIIHSAIVNYRSRIPIWFREGLAVRSEPWYKHLRVANVMKEARARKEGFSLEELTDQKGYPDEARVDLFYAQSYALTNAIYRSGTREQFLRFFHEIMDKDVAAAYKSVYGLDREVLLNRWKAHEDDLISLLVKD